MFTFILLLLLAVISLTFVALLVTVATVGHSPASLAALWVAPRQARHLLTNRHWRRNHALEHATIAILEDRFGRGRLASNPVEGGFVVRGAPVDQVADAAAEALRRLAAGERQLAVHPRSATSLLLALGLLGICTLTLMAVFRSLAAPVALLGLLALALVGPRLSLVLQRRLTTDTHVDTLAIGTVEFDRPRGRLATLSLLVLMPVVVRTEEGNARDSGTQTDVGVMTVITGERDEVAAGGYRVR